MEWNRQKSDALDNSAAACTVEEIDDDEAVDRRQISVTTRIKKRVSIIGQAEGAAAALVELIIDEKNIPGGHKAIAVDITAVHRILVAIEPRRTRRVLQDPIRNTAINARVLGEIMGIGAVGTPATDGSDDRFDAIWGGQGRTS